MTEYLVKFSGYLIIEAESANEAQEETEMCFCDGLNLQVTSVNKSMLGKLDRKVGDQKEVEG